jgi:MerR family transcriptional regulator, heat shock protein HspR
LHDLPHHRVENAAIDGGAMSAMRRERIEVSVDGDQGVFMISVAAELAHMHPQTLRMYEARGLIEPQRSAKNTRLYSQSDVERLRHIQQLTSSGLNLAGVEIVLDMEAEVERMRAKLERMRRHAAELERRISREGL